MHLLSRVLVIFIVCLVAAALPAAPVQAQCGGPFIELSPSSGLPGTEVIVYGYDCAENKLADIYYDGTLIATDRTSSSGDFTIIFTVPESSKGHYQVLADVGYASVDTYFNVKPGLMITPEAGPVGTTVTVKGLGFAENEESIELMYYLNGDYETIERSIVANSKGSWERSFQVPYSTRGEHEIDAEGAISRLHEVGNAVFRVTGEISLDKSSGSVGDIITMTGTRFVANEKGIQILFDDQAVVTGIKANSEGEWEASFEVPEIPKGEYSVNVEGEQTNREDVDEFIFEIKPDIMLSPDEGHVGTDLTVTGRGFAANKDVVISYEGSQVATTISNDKGSFEVSFLVPESPHGEHEITARVTEGANSTADLGTNVSAIFTMESDPPKTPYLISPPNRERVGLRSGITPTFEWSEVSDDSGVYYSLQIATSNNVTATGEFFDTMFSISGLVQTSYTLEETEALRYGTYYWIVQAVDGAENESGWTAARSFRVGLIPLWGFIVIIVAAVVLIVALIRALLRRRTIYYDRW